MQTENPQPSATVRKVFKTVLRYYIGKQFQKCLKEEGLDTLAYIGKCINKGMKASLGENKKIGRKEKRNKEHGSNNEKY